MPDTKNKKSSDRSVVVKLDYPLSWGEESISEITFHPPKAADIEHLGKDVTMKDIFLVASKCSKLELPKIRELDASDATKVADVISDFLGAGRETGEPST
jgi:hypothetical protein